LKSDNKLKWYKGKERPKLKALKSEQPFKDKKRLFVKFLKKLNGPFIIEEIDNDKEDILKISLKHKRNKYKAKKIYYRLEGSITSKRSASTYEEGGEVFADLNISKILYGEYKVFFRIMASKVKKKKGRGKKKGHRKLKAFFSFGKFEKVKIQRAFAELYVEHKTDQGFAFMSGESSYSDAGEIKEYIYKVYKDSKLITHITSPRSYIYVTFEELGSYELELTVTDEFGNTDVSERSTISVTNSLPTVVHSIKEVSELPGHYMVNFSDSFDADGDKDLLYFLSLYKEDEDSYDNPIRIYSEDPEIYFALNYQVENYTLRLRVYDSLNNYGQKELSFSHTTEIAPKIEWVYSEQNPDNPTEWWIGSSFINNENMDTFHYKATHEDGTVVFPTEPSTVKDNRIIFNQPGLWNIEYYGVDKSGLKSDVHTREILAEWTKEDLVPTYQWHSLDMSDHDPRIYYINAEFFDPLGEVVEHQIKATHPDGLVIKPILDVYGGREMRFPLKGDWEFEIIAIDNDGNESTPFNFTQYISWDFDSPIAEISVAQDESYPYGFYVKENKSYPATITTSFIKATNQDTGQIVEKTYNEDYFGFDLPSRGVWTLEYHFIDVFGIKSTTHSQQLIIIGSDIQTSVTKSSEPRTFNINTTGSFDPLVNETINSFYVEAEHGSGFKIFSNHYSQNFAQELTLLGNWTLKINGIDQWGLISGSRVETVAIVNELPLAAVNVSVAETWNKLSLDASSSSDTDGSIVKYEYTFYHDEGHSISHIVDVPNSTLELPMNEGVWSYTLKVYDNDNGTSEIQGSITLNNPRPIANFIAIEGNSWNHYYLNAMNSYDLDGHITNYFYTFNHISGTKLELSSSTQTSEINFPEEGEWSISLVVTDNFGKESEPIIKHIYIYDPNIKPVANVEYEHGALSGLVNFTSNSYDTDGDVVALKLRGVHETGISVEEEFQTGQFSLNLLEGMWEFELIAVDNVGADSDPYVFSIEVIIPEIMLSYKLESSSSPYKYILDMSETVAEGDVQFLIEVVKDDVSIFNQTTNETLFPLEIFYQNGSYEISVSASNDTFTTPVQIKNLNITHPNIGGDVIPEDPGEAADETLLGIDSDNDGVRDDIEIWVNNNSSIPNETKTFMKEMSKLFDASLKNANVKEDSINSTFREIAYTYCLESKLGREIASEQLAQMRINYFNTKERLLTWAQTQINFAGQAVVLDTDEANYAKYCN
tara:strand:+ start:2335 stop:5991 length:3657 start_codon:yes stop_codon:yes gene_type:complete